MHYFFTAATVLGLGTAVRAVNQRCVVPQELCYSLSIPDSTASSGTGDIYFQISASTSYSWAAFGEGSQMKGSNIFVMYTSSNGNNVTVSPRLATGYSEPQYNSAAQIAVLEGSGVINGQMVANVRCSNCQSWASGSEDFTASSANFVYAALSGSPLNSDSMTETIEEHDTKAAFSWDISAAKGGSANTNPFVAATSSSSARTTSTTVTGTATTTGASTTATGTSTTSTSSTATHTYIPSSCTPIAGATRPTATSAASSGSDGCPAGYASDGSSNSGTITPISTGPSDTLIFAHGVLACVAFVALFPTGGILIRIANFTGLLWVHAALQMVGYLFYLVAFGIGVYAATKLDYLKKTHPIIGIILFVVLFFQPILGVFHHKMYKKHGQRTVSSYLHLSIGRIAILLGMVNGGLGIKLANTASHGARIAYAIITACMAIAYIAVIFIGERRRGKQGSPMYDDNQKHHQLHDLSGRDGAARNSRHFGNAPPPLPPPPSDYYGGKF